MGSLCGTANTDDRPHRIRPVVRTVPVPITNRTERDRVEIDDKFKDFEEHNSRNQIYLINIDGKMIGEGIKQIPSYKCFLSDTELNKLREDFWGK